MNGHVTNVHRDPSEKIKPLEVRKEFGCDMCEKSYSQANALKSHIKDVHENTIRICEYCNKDFASKQNLQQHILKNHEESHPCDSCDFRFKELSELQNHVERVHEGLRFACHFCDKDFFHRTKLQSHLIKVHRCWKCDFCDVNFSTTTQ